MLTVAERQLGSLARNLYGEVGVYLASNNPAWISVFAQALVVLGLYMICRKSQAGNLQQYLTEVHVTTMNWRESTQNHCKQTSWESAG